jgi:ubiquinone/menaquinone biosynthesis C-methylase UbiE
LDVRPDKGVDVVGDAHKLPFKDNEFDNVLCTEVLEHLHTPVVAIAEMARVLKDGGTIILTTRFMFPIHDAPGDYFRYTKYGLRYLFRDWEILELKEETNVMETFAVLLQRLGYQSSLKGGKFTKAIVFICARIISKLSWILKEGYGDIERSSREDNFMSSGYYLAARIRK